MICYQCRTQNKVPRHKGELREEEESGVVAFASVRERRKCSVGLRDLLLQCGLCKEHVDPSSLKYGSRLYKYWERDHIQEYRFDGGILLIQSRLKKKSVTSLSSSTMLAL